MRQTQAIAISVERKRQDPQMNEDVPSKPAARKLTPAAERALAEATERRRQIDAAAKALPQEWQGRGGAEPIRYGDWEVKGIASDF